MKRIKIGGVAAAIFLAANSWASSLEVTDVKIAQRYPWNGLVDITYTVKSDNPDAEVFVYPIGYDADKATKVALNPKYLSGEGVNGGVKPGTRRMVWDMASQMGKDYNRAAFSGSFIAYCDAKPYMVVDLSEGSSAKDYPISYLSSIPDGGWTDEYKTTKMVFRLIPPGQLTAAVQTNVQITKPFYFALWPLTTQQYSLIMGGNGNSEIKTGLSYNDIRGNILGSAYPEHQQVDADSIVGKLRMRTGITFDLGTQWQWLSAATAYTDRNSPQTFGIYQMGSNVEWCVNWYSDDNETAYDPVGPLTDANNARATCGVRVVVRTGNLKKGEYGSYTETSATDWCGALGSYVVYHYYNQGYNYYTTDCYYTPGVRTHSYSAGHDPVCRLVALPNCK